MTGYIIRRLLLMIPTLAVISIISFVVIELPPGDYVTIQVMQMEAQQVSPETIENLRHQYGLDRPLHERYFRWVGNFVRGDFGYSLSWNKPVREMIGGRLGLTIVVSLSALLFTWAIAIPIGAYAALRQYSIGDYLFTFVGFLGLSVPNFMLALILMFVAYKYMGISVGGLFSETYQSAAWSWGKVFDLLAHLWIPMIVVGTAGTAGLIRIVRANLLDELGKPYVVTARAKGLKEFKLLFKYPLKIAINPLVSSIGWLLPSLISGATITAVVLGLPTAGPLFLGALKRQDMQLAGAFVMLTSSLTVIGTLLSDILLAVIDPRIRYESR